MADIRARLDDLTDPDPSPAERALVARVLTSFTGTTAPAVDRLAEALSRHDLPAVRERAHGLKGSAANIGATALAAHFAELEDGAHAGQLPDPAGTLAAIRAELDIVTPIVSALADELHHPPAG
jgi:HPt (histidine-containing phosphotransfer) domain-containing protein